MFWADDIAQKVKERKLPLEWVDDMKTPSGKIHVGALRGVIIHDLAYKALKDAKVNTKYTYIFDDHDPMDSLPIYLDKEKYEQYMGTPLYKIPSPDKNYVSFAKYYAQDFVNVFNEIGCNPEVLWASELYLSGKMNPIIEEALNKADLIRKVYEELYKKEMSENWFPFQPFCPKCGKVSTTVATGWDGKLISFECQPDKVKWTKGCGYKGKMSPFSTKDNIAGKLPWKIEWPGKWKALGITVEGAGKDHMSSGGSHDFAKLICERVFDYKTPLPLAYEFFLVGGKKMSSSKGLGTSASDMLDILPPQLLRFLMVKTKINQAINFDPSGNTIPDLFDEYQKAADSYFSKKEDDLARIFEFSQIGKIEEPPRVRFSVLAQWVQMPNMEAEIKKENLLEWAKFARNWVEKYAQDEDKFQIEKELPKKVTELSENQKKYLGALEKELSETTDPEEIQLLIYNKAKKFNLSSKEGFSAVYTAFIGKDHGPKAGWLLVNLDKEFIRKRLIEASS